MKGVLTLLILFSIHVDAQNLLKGSVVDAGNGQPVAGASVFLSNTSVGTVADANGRFSINIPQGKYDLIVSSIGYETGNQIVASNLLPVDLVVRLQPKSKELETVVLEPIEKDGWARWGRFFIESFIGTSAFARECILKNPGVVKFRNSKKTGSLTAFAAEPLVIENKALGYTIIYQLEDFNYNFKKHLLYYEGYPLFKEMGGSPGKLRRWQKARADVYRGSMMHFMRAVFRNSITQEAFDVFALKKVTNSEKLRVKNLEATKRLHSANDEAKTGLTPDSAAYYRKVLAQADYFDVAGKTQLTGDSIAYAVNSNTAGLDFSNYLLIIYDKKAVPAEYRQAFPDNGTAMMSQVTLINQKAIEIQSNGSYYPPAEIMSLGYWAWFEKIATMLPFDYTEKE